MKTYYHAVDENALRNGSFVIEYRGKFNSSYARYALGDFQGWTQTVDKGLKQWDAKEARKVRN